MREVDAEERVGWQQMLVVVPPEEHSLRRTDRHEVGSAG